VYWRRDRGAGMVAITVDTMSLLGDIIAVLPDGQGDASEQVQLRDASGRALYQWGGYRPGAAQTPQIAQPLAAPLDSWQLLMYFDDQRLRGAGGRLRVLQLAIALGSLVLVLLGLGIWLYRELRRAAREATERVNFVNQVSHELRTPLTNIRMYAELLEGHVDDDPGTQHKLEVIIAEGRRLGRLIDNVLTFARQQKNTLRLHKAPHSLDDLLREVVEHLRPGLRARGIEVGMECGAPTRIALDPDAIAGIIDNLLSNVGKYAPGKPLRLITSESESWVYLRVADSGPGVARRHRGRIFEPFYRAGDKLTEGVSGTGIGLSIARQLAGLHGGDLRLVDAQPGAVFELRLPKREELE